MSEETKDKPQEAEAQSPVEGADAEVQGPVEAADAEAQSPVEAADAEAPDQQAESKLPENKVTIEDAGTLKKKITIEIPRERIDAKYEEMFGELGRTAQVPGFRVGRAPRRLIEKRFGKEVSEDVRNAVVGDALGPSLEDKQLKVIGEPDIKLDEIELPEEGEMTFTFEVEVAPELELPEYKGLEIRRPAVEVTEQRLEEAMTSWLRGYGRLRPVDSPIQADDLIVANIEIKGEGIEQALPNTELRVAPAEVEGIPLEDVPKALLGKKVGDTCRMKTRVPSAHPNESWRDKEVTITFAPQEVKRLELPELDEDLARQAGFASPEELRQAVRQNLQAKLVSEQKRSMRDQVCQHLLANTKLEVPAGVASRQAARLLARRYVDLLMRGVPRDQIEQNAQRLEAAAAEQAQQDLKLTFILAKLAETEEVTVEDGEVNARIAQIAREQKRRPERLRQELSNEGTLDHLVTAIREEKTIEKVLESAKITKEPAEGAAPAAEARKPRRSRAAGKQKKPTSSKK